MYLKGLVEFMLYPSKVLSYKSLAPVEVEVAGIAMGIADISSGITYTEGRLLE